MKLFSFVRVLGTCLSLLAAIESLRAEVIELEGKVKAVNADDRTISIERKTAKGTKTLDLDVNKKAGDLSSLKVGDEILFSYDPDLELVTKIGGGDASKSNKAGRPVCRIGFGVSADGTSSGFIEEVQEVAGDENRRASERKEAGGGLWTITHRFADRKACGPYKASLAGKASAAFFSPLHRAIELKPSADINGGWANLHPPYRLRLPATVVVEVEAIDQKTYVTLPLKTGLMNTEINVLSDDGLRTCDVSHLFVTFSKERKAPEIRKAYNKDDVPLAEGCRYDIKPDPSMSLQEMWGTGVSSFLGPTKTCSGIRVKQIAITARFAPMLGVAMKQDGDRVVVEQVIPDSQAEAAGIKPSDHVVAVSGKPVSQWQRAMQLLAVTELGENWDIEIERGGQKKTFMIKAEVP